MTHDADLCHKCLLLLLLQTRVLLPLQKRWPHDDVRPRRPPEPGQTASCSPRIRAPVRWHASALQPTIRRQAGAGAAAQAKAALRCSLQDEDRHARCMPPARVRGLDARGAGCGAGLGWARPGTEIAAARAPRAPRWARAPSPWQCSPQPRAAAGGRRTDGPCAGSQPSAGPSRRPRPPPPNWPRFRFPGRRGRYRPLPGRCRHRRRGRC